MTDKIFDYSDFPVCTVIPKMTWNQVSPEQQIRDLYKALCSLAEYSNSLRDALEELGQAIEEALETLPDTVDQLIREWIAANLSDIVQAAIAQAMQNVWFGLTEDGHFCAYIPESWADITFDTGCVFGTEWYGRLILKYNVLAGAGVIDNTDPWYPCGTTTGLLGLEELNEKVTQLESRIEEMEG